MKKLMKAAIYNVINLKYNLERTQILRTKDMRSLAAEIVPTLYKPVSFNRQRTVEKGIRENQNELFIGFSIVFHWINCK